MSNSRPLWLPEGYSEYDSVDNEESDQDGSETLGEETEHSKEDEEEDAEGEYAGAGSDHAETAPARMDVGAGMAGPARVGLPARRHVVSEWPADEDTLIVDPPTPHPALNGSLANGTGHGHDKWAGYGEAPGPASAHPYGRTLKTVSVNTPLPERTGMKARAVA